MRLDHLLSREIRVPTLGGIGALMAPRLIARSFSHTARLGMLDPARDPEAERDLVRNTQPSRTSFQRLLPLFSGQGAAARSAASSARMAREGSAGV